MKQLFLLLILSFGAPFLKAQSEVTLSIELLTPDLIGKAILDQNELIEWVKLINEDIKTECASVKGNKDVLVIVTIHSDKDATITTFSNPKVQESIMADLQTKLEAHTSPRSKFNEYSFLVSAKINKGVPEGNEFPAQFLPYQQKMEAFGKLSLYEKQQDIQLWMKTDILPLLAYYETNVDSMYAGVLSVGNLLNEGEFLQETVDHLTDENPDYWRATMEMSRGNQLIPFTKACMFIANGEFDKARRILDVIRYFYDETTLPAKLDDQISDKLDLYTKELGDEINKGIAFHDAGKYDDAIKYYEKLLEVHPNSAWLNYELYFSKNAASGEMDIEGNDWNTAKKKVYACDPMYPINARAKTGKEGYEFYRRQQINELFSSKENIRSDFAKYADIALDLESYGFAAQIYWLALSHLKAEDYDDRDLLAHFLYCIDKLGDRQTINNFKEDYSEKFAQIEAERLELMENSFMYKAFKKEE